MPVAPATCCGYDNLSQMCFHFTHHRRCVIHYPDIGVDLESNGDPMVRVVTETGTVPRYPSAMTVNRAKGACAINLNPCSILDVGRIWAKWEPNSEARPDRSPTSHSPRKAPCPKGRDRVNYSPDHRQSIRDQDATPSRHLLWLFFVETRKRYLPPCIQRRAPAENDGQPGSLALGRAV